MKAIRIGNDITIRATVTRRGQEEDFTGKTLRLILRSAYERRELQFTVSGNTLTALFPGTEQTKTGTYTVTLVEDYGTDSRNTADLCPAFRLASCSCDDADVLTGAQTLDLALDITVPASGLSAYELALLHGYEGTEEEWVSAMGANASAIAALLTSVTALQEAPQVETIEGQEVRRYCGGHVWVMQKEFALSSEFEEWAALPAVCGRTDFGIVFVRQLNDNNAQTGILLNTLSNTDSNALQTYFFGKAVLQRTIEGISGDTQKVSAWLDTAAYSLSVDTEANTLSLLAPNTSKVLSTVTLPAAGAGADTTEIEETLSELTSTVETMSATVNEIDSTYSTTTSKVSSLETNVELLQKSAYYYATKEQLSTLEESLNNKITALQEAVAALQENADEALSDTDIDAITGA